MNLFSSHALSSTDESDVSSLAVAIAGVLRTKSGRRRITSGWNYSRAPTFELWLKPCLQSCCSCRRRLQNAHGYRPKWFSRCALPTSDHRMSRTLLRFPKHRITGCAKLRDFQAHDKWMQKYNIFVSRLTEHFGVSPFNHVSLLRVSGRMFWQRVLRRDEINFSTSERQYVSRIRKWCSDVMIREAFDE